MDALPDLKVISRCGTGMDNVDRAYAAEKGIAVRNTPDGPTLAVAELTLGSSSPCSAKCRIRIANCAPASGRSAWATSWHGKNVGIVGFGKIGQAVAHLLEPFGVNVGYHDPFADVPGYTRLELDDLMGWADVITLHCPQDRKRRPAARSWPPLPDAPRSFILNIARGGSSTKRPSSACSPPGIWRARPSTASPRNPMTARSRRWTTSS